MQILGFILTCVGWILEPITLIAVFTIAILSKSKYTVAFRSVVFALIYGALTAYITSGIDQHTRSLESWISQILGTIWAGELIYFIKWVRNGRSNADKLKKINNLSLVDKDLKE